MNRILVVACVVLGLAIAIASFPEGIVAVAVAATASAIVVLLVRFKWGIDSAFLTKVFLIALLARLAFGLVVSLFDLQGFFGGDAGTYDTFGYSLMLTWFGYPPEVDVRVFYPRLSSVGWGMYYFVATIYSIVGRSPLTAQLLCSVIGAATAPLAYVCSFEIFGNKRVGRFSAYFVALYPAFIVWSAQLLKDGMIIFFLVLAITMVLETQRKLSYPKLGLLLFSLGAILSLRSYIFYMVAVAVVGMFVVGIAKSQRAMIASFLGLIVIGVTFTYIGGLESTSRDIVKFTDLEMVQRSRLDLAQRAESGFNEDVDVSTTAGALQAVPVGLVYLIFAPFPWQINNIRQFLTLPDMLVWWLSIPFIISGTLYTLRNRLREAFGVLIFTALLTLAYSIFQGNVGTAYRQRTQIQVFLFMFAAVGITLQLEKRENSNLIKRKRREEFERNYRERERLRVEGA